MTDLNLGQCSPPVPTIIIGEDASLDVKLVTSAPPKDPFDLSGASEIVAKFLNADNTVLSLTLTGSEISIVSGQGGHIKIAISAAQSALLAVPADTPFANFELYITIASKLTIVQLPNSVKILNRIFP